MKIEEEAFYKVLGEKIASERKKVGMTQEQLGEILSLSRVSVVNIENGKQKPSIYQLYLIVEKFNVTLDSLTSAYHFSSSTDTENIQGREIDKRSLIEFSNFLNQIKK
ncbi:helix-turn-helix transcriptional regulator [Mucilaginibacter jinjuensis]|uniref:Helix-turn-helix transcriptional regulator n=1 Tax=Mucilaginibacter jinjuensis TaxID=1176721 RepID=A0ABY7T3P9_9SPHI|nr:helix-turn-helix transcriptional regulator [Mucilaginibacter jinjuensis]WCT11012.1 helix-turn-helix transcriptional regulator [Mucilaginibacter jinjuensis]